MAADVVRLGPVGPVFEFLGASTARGITWAWARQDLDMATASLASHELTGLLSAVDGPDRLLVHLGGGCFVDLHGLRVLVDVAAQVRARGGTLLVVAPPRCLQVMIATTGLGAELPSATTAARAARWARGRGGVPVTGHRPVTRHLALGCRRGQKPTGRGRLP